MKFVIWFVCCFVFAFIQMFLRDAGILLGGIPTAVLAAAMFWVARKLCEKWNHREIEKKARSHNMTVYEFVQKATNKDVIKKCEELKCTKELKPYLEQQMEWGTITKEQADLLLRFFK